MIAGTRANEVVMLHGTKIPKAQGAHHALMTISVPGNETTLKGIKTMVDVKKETLRNPVARLMIHRTTLETTRVVNATVTNVKVPKQPAVAKAKRAKDPKTTPVATKAHHLAANVRSLVVIRQGVHTSL